MSDAQADVSVIIPMYNAQRFIVEAIESVRAQTVAPREIIIVDDGSDDGGVTAVKAFDPDITILSQSNAGAAAARQAGVAKAQGALLAFLDADDLWLPSALELRLAVLDACPELDAVYGGVQQFVCDTAPEELRQSRQIHTGTEAARHPGCLLIRAEAYRGMGGFNPAIREGEMLDFVARFDEAGYTARVLPDLVYRRRVHGNNTVLKAKTLDKAYLAVLRERLQRSR